MRDVEDTAEDYSPLHVITTQVPGIKPYVVTAAELRDELVYYVKTGCVIYRWVRRDLYIFEPDAYGDYIKARGPVQQRLSAAEMIASFLAYDPTDRDYIVYAEPYNPHDLVHAVLLDEYHASLVENEA